MTEPHMTWKARIVIIGSGIGGLAAAVAIAQKCGHQVCVLETASRLTEAGAGIQITPNASIILSSWGLQHEFEKIATVSDFMEIRRYATNAAIGLVPSDVNGYARRVWGSPHWTVHRIDYQDALAKQAIALGVEIYFNAKVVAFDAVKGYVTLVDGRILDADIIIGADGIHSRARQSIPGLAGIEPTRAQNYCYRVLLTREQMLSHESTSEIMMNSNRMAWPGHEKHIIGYPIASGQLYNLVLILPDKDHSAPLNQYNQPGSPAEMLAEFHDWHPAIRTMLSLATSCARWTLADLLPLPTWHSSNGRVVLLGDSAHATTPHAASGAALAVEDAEVLSHCIAACPGQADLTRYMGIYGRTRKARCERVAEVSRESAMTFSTPDGPAQVARDERFAGAREDILAQIRGERELVLPAADESKPFPHPEFMMWLYGYDASAAAVEALGSA